MPKDRNTCPNCGKGFANKQNLNRHVREVHGDRTKFRCDICERTFARLEYFTRHKRTHNLDMPGPSNLEPIGLPRTPLPGSFSPSSVQDLPPLLSPIPASPIPDETPPASPSLAYALDDTLSSIRFNPEEYDIAPPSSVQDLPALLSPIPASPIPDETPPASPSLAHALNDTLASIRFNAEEYDIDPAMFIERYRASFRKFLTERLLSKRGVKWFLLVRSVYTRPLGGEDQEAEARPYFRSNMQTTLLPDVIEGQLDDCIETIQTAAENFEGSGSGWVICRILYVELNVASYQPLRGSSYIKLPKKLTHRQSILNIRNDDQKCFLWSILAKLHPISYQNHPYRVSKYRQYENELDTSSISLPFELDPRALKKFELANNLSVNVFGYEDGLFPLYVSTNKCCEEREVDLLYITDETKEVDDKNRHYCLIRDLGKLLQHLTKHGGTSYYCRMCLHRFSGHNAEKRRNEHIEECAPHGLQKTAFPKKKVVTFENIDWEHKVQYVLYADFEAKLVKIQGCHPNPDVSNTTKLNQHISSAYSWVLIGPNGIPIRNECYLGIDANRKFIESILELEDELIGLIKTNVPIIISSEEEVQFKAATECYICRKPLNGGDMPAVRDHCHFTGKYRGPAHALCNLNLKVPDFIPVFIHNLSRYDLHILCQEIGRFKHKNLQCIPSNSETYISLSLGKFRFLDSYRFLSESLENLVSNLATEGMCKFPVISKFFNADKVNLLLRKGVYPYEYVDDEEKFNETVLPSRDAFYSSLKDENISEADFTHAQNVWRTFNIQTLGEYTKLYVNSDAMLLADVFESFRALSIKHYNLDPAHAYTTPGLAWQAALKMTEVRLSLIDDISQHLFVEKGIRGGVSMVSTRYSEANNKYMPETYDESKESSYICYLDANNLYGTVMCEPLPVGDFQWVEEGDLNLIGDNILNIPNDGKTGYILEVDLEYPPELHTLHNDLPVAAETKIITLDMLSPYSKVLLQDLNIKENQTIPKLLPNLNNKEKYVVHYRNLKYYVELGLIITKVHRVLSFTQEKWLEKYVRFNTEQRKLAKNSFEKSYWKLMVNAVFGKTMENVRKHINFELIHKPERMLKVTSSPTFEHFTIFNEDLAGAHKRRTKLELKKPLYIGFTILDLSKELMYKFHYGFIKKKYGDKATLLFTDTDSLTYNIQTGDLYKDFEAHQDHFDFSDYPTSHFLHSNKNKKALGYFKDETNSQLIQNFVGLRPKLYSIRLYGESKTVEEIEKELRTGKSLEAILNHKKVCKGIAKNVIRNVIRHEDYERCLFDRKTMSAEMKRIASFKHDLFTLSLRKLALSPNDDKRYILPCGIRTLAHGHKDIKMN